MIKLIKSTFYNEEDTKNKLVDFIKSAKQLSFGPECLKFEDNFAKYQGSDHCIFFNSGSSANLALIQALLNIGKIKKGDNIGFSAITWATNVMPLLQLGLNVVPVDVELDTLNISSKKLKDFLGKNNIKALFLTNLLGFCDDVDEIRNICKEKDVILLEDNCESLGTVYKGEKLGNFGLASTFSFYVGHHMSTIEGGAVCTNDKRIASMLRKVRAHGWDRNLDDSRRKELIDAHGIESEFYSRYTFYDLGYNLRPTEINGFLGNVQIKYLDEISEKRKNNFMNLTEVVHSNAEKYFPLKYSHIDMLSNFAVPVVCKSEESRDDLIRRCDGKIEVRPIVGGDMTSQPFFKKYIPDHDFDCPNAKFIHEHGIYFGNNPELTEEEINQIKNVFA